MKLALIKLATGLMLNWNVPEAGTTYLWSTEDNHHWRVEFSYHARTKCQATYKVPADRQHRFYKVEFVADNGGQHPIPNR